MHLKEGKMELYNKDKTYKFVKMYDPEPRPREYYLTYICDPEIEESWKNAKEFIGILAVFNDDKDNIILPTLIEDIRFRRQSPAYQCLLAAKQDLEKILFKGE